MQQHDGVSGLSLLVFCCLDFGGQGTVCLILVCFWFFFFLCSDYIQHSCVFYARCVAIVCVLNGFTLNNMLLKKKKKTLRGTNLFQMKPERESRFWSTL